MYFFHSLNKVERGATNVTSLEKTKAYNKIKGKERSRDKEIPADSVQLQSTSFYYISRLQDKLTQYLQNLNMS